MYQEAVPQLSTFQLAGGAGTGLAATRCASPLSIPVAMTWSAGISRADVVGAPWDPRGSGRRLRGPSDRCPPPVPRSGRCHGLASVGDQQDQGAHAEYHEGHWEWPVPASEAGARRELVQRRAEGSEDANGGLTAPAFWAGGVYPSLSTFTPSLDSPIGLVPQRILAQGAGLAWSG
jgi:hypothetical protein